MAGRAGLALIEGPAGIGKSALLAEAAATAAEQRRMLVLSARGSLLEKEYGFGALRQIFDPVLLDADRRGSRARRCCQHRCGSLRCHRRSRQHRSPRACSESCTAPTG